MEKQKILTVQNVIALVSAIIIFLSGWFYMKQGKTFVATSMFSLSAIVFLAAVMLRICTKVEEVKGESKDQD